MKLQQHENLKLTQNDSFVNNFFFDVFGQKKPKMGPKQGFSGIIKGQCMEIF